MSASALFAQGYTDLVKVASGDKRPVMIGWQNLEVTKEMAAQWDGTTANIGLRGDRFPAIDIDLGDDAETANAIVKVARDMLGGAPVRFSPKSGSRLLVYRTEETFLKMKLALPNGKGAVEVLPAGRQYLVKGIHPAGGPYVWNKRDLWDIHSQRLAVITEADALAFLEHLAEEFGGRVHVAHTASEAKLSPDELRAPSVEAVAELVAAMPNSDAFLETAFPNAGDERDAWVAFGMAVKGAAGDAGLEIFVEWTSRYEDGVPDLDLARAAYHGFAPERYGWPTLQRIYRTQVETAEDIFSDDLLEGDEGEIVEVDVDSIPTMEEMSEILHGDLASRLAYAAGTWWVWDGSRWVQDDKEGLRAELIIRDRLTTRARALHEQGVAMGVKEGRAHRNAAAKFQSSNGIAGVKSLMRARHVVDRGGFDSDLMALNTPGGLVDLRTGKVRPSVPSDYVTRTTSVAMPGEYDPAKAPNWEAFLEYLTYGDEEYRAFLQRYTGYALTGRMDEKKFVFIHGAESNTGKSTFVNAIQYVMGDYSQSVSVDMFMSKRRDNTDDLAQLPGVRLVTATEPRAGQQWNDGIIKAITGRDEITCRRLYGSYFSFTPQFKILIAGNHQPSLTNVDTALFKRILMTPMDRVAEKPDTQLAEKLRAEAGMILRWMLEGCLSWGDNGLKAPGRVTDWTEEYTDEEDTLRTWFSEECVQADAWTPLQDLFDSWRGWNRRNNVYATDTKNMFSRELKARQQELGIRKRKHGAVGFDGVKLKEIF